MKGFIMKKLFFVIVSAVVLSACATNQPSQKTDNIPCQTINKFYKERCEVVGVDSKSIERMIEDETRQVRLELKRKPERDF